MEKTIEPSDAGDWFPVCDVVFDEIMPKLSTSAWKVLSVVIRQTWGRAAGDDFRKGRKWDIISYSQFKEKTGIGSYSTVSRAIKECLEAGYPIRRQEGEHPHTGKPIYAYSLDIDVEQEAENGVETA